MLKLCVHRSLLLGLGVVVLLGWLSVPGLRAQVLSTATILGTVTDASGAAVAGAMVTVKNSGTGVTNTTVTDAQGRYSVPQLIIGNYEVDVEATGFKKYVHGGIVLTVGAETVVDATLEVGTVQQSVTVESDVTHVETTSSTVSTLVQNTQLVQLPLNGRSYEQLISLAPGVNTITNNGTQGGSLFYGQQNNYSVSGARPSGQYYLLDDANTADFWNHATGSGALGTTLGIDSIAEFQTLTNTYSAQFGGAGVAINASTKSGTNNFHGTAYEFLRNTAVEADNFYIPTPTPLPTPTLNRNQFGVALGGPIKKNKAFFFVNYEGLRMVQNSPTTLSEPDLAARGCEGMSVAACQADGNVGPNPYVINGKTITPAPCNGGNPGLYPNSMYPLGNGCTAQDSARAVLSLLPIGTQADNPKTGFGVVNANNVAYSSENYGLARFDYTLSDKDTIFARVVTDTAQLLTNGTLGGQDGAGTAPYFPQTATTADTYLTIEERRVFSPTLLNTVHFSYVRPAEAAYQYGQPTVNAAQIGVQPFANCGNCLQNSPTWFFGISSNYNQVATAPFPTNAVEASVNGREAGSINGLYAGPTATVPFYLIPNNFTLGDDVIWTKGSHNIKFGMNVERMDEQTWAPFQTGASWTPNSLADVSQGVISPIAGLLMGEMNTAGSGELPDSTLAAYNLPHQDGTLDVRETLFSPYIQDDWKVTGRLTVNLGLRYEPTLDPSIANHINENMLNAPWAGTTNGSLVTTANSPIGPNGQPTYPAGTNCGAPVTTQLPSGPVTGLPLACGWVPISHIFQNNFSLRNWDPRIGLAWDPFKDHKTSVRAGFGIFHTVVVARDYDMWLQPPFLPGLENVNAANQPAGSPLTYPFIFQSVNPCSASPFPTTGPGPALSNAAAVDYQNCLSIAAGGSTYYNWSRTPYTEQWNINVQREILPDTIASIAYVGSRGIDLVAQRDMNAILPCGGTDPATGSLIYTQGYAPTFAGGSYLPCPRQNPDMLGDQLLNAGWQSWYNSLQASLNRRFSHGFLLQASYAYSKEIDTASGSYGLDGGGVVSDPWNYQVNKGLSGWNRYQNLTVNGVYALPFHKNQLVEGWQLSGIFTFLSGLPGTVAGASVSGYGPTVNVVPGCSVYNAGVTPAMAANHWLTGPNAGQATNPMLNANCFAQAAPGEVGNAGRNVIIGPGGWNLDLSIVKDTKITKISENFVLEFRFEAFNALNHPDWANQAPFIGGGFGATPMFNICTNKGAAYGTAAPCGTVGQIQTLGAFPGNNNGVSFAGLGPNDSNPEFGAMASNPLFARQIQFALRATF